LAKTTLLVDLDLLHKEMRVAMVKVTMLLLMSLTDNHLSIKDRDLTRMLSVACLWARTIIRMEGTLVTPLT
jgi:hypothetical protein